MLFYDNQLRTHARALRNGMTESEVRLWSRLRSKQVLGIQFYRQKPIGLYIADFYAPKVRLVIELDGSQHLDPFNQEYDAKRDAYLKRKGLTVVRFHNLQVLKETNSVLELIYRIASAKLAPSFSKNYCVNGG